jgi:small subunit ribosomal protein S4e
MEPNPGPHSKMDSIPLGVVIRDILGYAKTSKEADIILRSGYVKVNGKIRKEKNFSTGLMDVIVIGDESFRILPTKKGLRLVKIDRKESNTRLLKIVGKTCLKKKKVQLNMHDGSNMLLDKDDYKTNNILVYDVEQKKIKDVLRLEKGCKALVTRGRNIGSIVTISDIIITRSSMKNQVIVDMSGKSFTLPVDCVFAIGKDSPIIRIGE